MNKLFEDKFNEIFPPLQCSPFGKESEIDFIVEDEASYYAMADDIKGDSNEW